MEPSKLISAFLNITFYAAGLLTGIVDGNGLDGDSSLHRGHNVRPGIDTCGGGQNGLHIVPSKLRVLLF